MGGSIDLIVSFTISHVLSKETLGPFLRDNHLSIVLPIFRIIHFCFGSASTIMFELLARGVYPFHRQDFSRRFVTVALFKTT